MLELIQELNNFFQTFDLNNITHCHQLIRYIHYFNNEYPDSDIAIALKQFIENQCSIIEKSSEYYDSIEHYYIPRLLNNLLEK